MTGLRYFCFYSKEREVAWSERNWRIRCIYMVLQLYASELTSYLNANLPTWYFLSIGNCKSISPTFNVLTSFSVLELVAFNRALVCGQNTSICRWKFNLSNAYHHCNIIVAEVSGFKSLKINYILQCCFCNNAQRKVWNSDERRSRVNERYKIIERFEIHHCWSDLDFRWIKYFQTIN